MPSLIPVDHDPFGDIGGAMPESYGTGFPIMDPIDNLVRGALKVAAPPGQVYQSTQQRAEGGAVDDALPLQSDPIQDTPPKANLLDQARAQYPILNNYDYGYTENFRPNSGYLEHWEPGDQGTAPTSANSLDALRPNDLPLDKPGLEIRDPTTRPIDILADITSHHLINTDPVVKQAYEDLQNSMTPAQESILQDQYSYAQKNEGETGSYEDWKERAGMPGFFRGYTFQQWPKEFTDRAFTPDQRKNLDNLMGYLKSSPAPQGGNSARLSPLTMTHSSGRIKRDHP